MIFGSRIVRVRLVKTAECSLPVLGNTSGAFGAEKYRFPVFL
jgi:hypothetical protein